MYNISGNPHRYHTILHLPHPTSSIHPRMSRQSRAAQFAPFEALSGHSQILAETARQTEAKKEPDEDQKQTLNRILQFLQRQQEEHPTVSVLCFCPDDSKEGGTYRRFAGQLQAVDSRRRCLCFLDGHTVPFSRIFDMECSLPFDFM